MNAYCLHLLEALVRSGVVLTIFACIVILMLRFLSVTSTSLRRLLWFAVIFQGCLLIRITIATPALPILSKSISHVAAKDNETESIFKLPSVMLEVAETLFSADSSLESGRAGLISSLNAWFVVPICIWITGIGVIGIRWAWYYLKFIRCLPDCQLVPDEWAAEWQTLLNEAGIKRRVILRASSHLGPLLCWHPQGYQLIVPGEVWRLLEPRQRIMILRHELAHLTRGDIWKSFVLRLLALPHWFNPLAWWVVRQFDEDAERACDDAVRQSGPSHAFDYARTLLLLGGSHGETLFASQAAGSNGLAGRIRRLIDSNSRKDSNMKKLTIVTLVLGLSALHLLRFQSLAEDQTAESKIEATNSASLTKVDIIGTDGIHIEASDVENRNRRTEAVVDMRYLFQHLDQFIQQREQLKQLIAEKEVWAKAEMVKLRQATADDQQRKEYEQKKAQHIQEFVKFEREMYQTACNNICSEIKDFAKEHGIRVVRKKSATHDVRMVGAQKADTIQSAKATTAIVAVGDAVRVPTEQQSTAEDKNDNKGVTIGVQSVELKDVNLNISTSTAPAHINLVSVPSDNGENKILIFNSTDGQLKSGTITLTGATVTKTKEGQTTSGILLGTSGVLSGVESKDSFENILAKEVLFADSTDEYDITEQILNRLNARFKQEQSAKSSK